MFKKGHRHSEETKKKIGDALRNQIYFNCDYCGRLSSDRPSQYKKKKRHFCSRKCYSMFRKEKLPLEEQHAYKGIAKTKEEAKRRYIYHVRYKKRHPERISHLKARDYVRRKKAEGSHTFEEWEELKKKYDYKCAICKQKKKLTKDHIIPLSEGGTDYITNIQPLCRNCNSRKWKKLVFENPEMITNKPVQPWKE